MTLLLSLQFYVRCAYFHAQLFTNNIALGKPIAHHYAISNYVMSMVSFGSMFREWDNAGHL